jgi:plasminogen activator inhibitor 1 RNA-binding protein
MRTPLLRSASLIAAAALEGDIFNITFSLWLTCQCFYLYRGREVSKDGAGPANWGSEKQEAHRVEKHEEEPEPVAADETVEEGAEVVAEEPAAPDSPPEPPVFTLDEYNAKRAQARQNSEAFGEVAVRQVTDDFKGLKTKTEEEDVFIALGSKQSKGKQGKDQRSTTRATIADVAFVVAPPEPPASSRGGRGGDRGGRGGDRGGRGDRPRTSEKGAARGDRGGRGGRSSSGRGNAPRGPRVDIFSAEAFPSL